LGCAFCSAQHSGGVEQAVDDGWNFAVFSTKKDGRVQMAGCPLHRDEIMQKMLDFVGNKAPK
jgi:hypothetical protein